jgi:hypothetical protein
MPKTKRDKMYTKYTSLRAEYDKLKRPSKKEAEWTEKAQPYVRTPGHMVPTRDVSLTEYLEASKALEKANQLYRTRSKKINKVMHDLHVTREKFERYEDLENKMVIKSLVRQKTDRDLPNVAEKIYKYYSQYNNPS